MATITDGYNGQATEIRVAARGTDAAELWIEQDGLPKYSTNAEGVTTQIDRGVETLAYITIQEAITLRDELNVAIKEMAGL
jgi:hypothetical protein